MHVNSYPCLNIKQISLIVTVQPIKPSKQNTPVLAHEGKGMSTQCWWFLSCGDLGSPCFCVGNGIHDWTMYTSDVWTWLFITNLHSREECSLAGHTYLPCAHTGRGQEERGRRKNTYGVNGQVFVHLRQNVGSTNQIAVNVISNSSIRI